MKNGFLILVIATFLLQGCDARDESNGLQEATLKNQQVSSVTNKEATKEQFLEDIQVHIAYLNECNFTAFGADTTNSIELSPGYTSEVNALNNVIDGLFLWEERGKYPQYRSDLVSTGYKRVNNFKKIDEVETYLEQFLATDLIATYHLEDYFFEYEEDLYLANKQQLQGNPLDVDSVKFLEETDGVYSVLVDELIHNDKANTIILDFEYIEERWLLTAIREKE